MSDTTSDRRCEAHLAHARALAQLIGLTAALAVERPEATSVRELAGPVAFVSELLADTVSRAERAALRETAALETPASERRA